MQGLIWFGLLFVITQLLHGSEATSLARRAKRGGFGGGGGGGGLPCRVNNACECPLGQQSLGIPCDAKRPWPQCPPQSYCYATNTVDIGPYFCCPVWSTVGAAWRPTRPFYNYVPPPAPNWGCGGGGCGGGFGGAVAMPVGNAWPSFWPKAARKLYKKKAAIASAAAIKRKAQRTRQVQRDQPVEK